MRRGEAFKSHNMQHRKLVGYAGPLEALPLQMTPPRPPIDKKYVNT